MARHRLTFLLFVSLRDFGGACPADSASTGLCVPQPQQFLNQMRALHYGDKKRAPEFFGQ